MKRDAILNEIKDLSILSIYLFRPAIAKVTVEAVSL